MKGNRELLLFVLAATALLTMAAPGLVEAKTVSTKRLQIVVVGADPDLFFYRSNNGAPDPITPDLTVTNPPGSTYIFKAGLFLGGTVDPSQSSYAVDKNGTPLSARTVSAPGSVREPGSSTGTSRASTSPTKAR